jgi:hypothetical protein
MTTSGVMSACCEVALMKPITGAAGLMLDHRLEALTHLLLGFQELVNNGRPAAAFERRLSDLGKPPRRRRATEVVVGWREPAAARPG